MDFVTRFHNLEGLTVSEKRKNLYILLRDKNLASFQDEFVKNLIPKTYLESIFKVEVLIWFHRTDELYEIFKQGNDVLVSKIIKQRWFIKEIFTNIPIKDLINKIIPTMSYALRMKVLKKISTSITEDKCDELFEALFERYGIFVAQQFLSSCSANKIEQVLKSNDIVVHAGHLKKFFKKDQKLIIVYVEEYKKHDSGNFSITELYRHIGKEDIGFFLELQKKFMFHIMVGRRTTKKIIDFTKEDLINNPKNYTTTLKKNVVPGKLKSDFRIFYKNLFPTSIHNWNETYTCNEYLKYVPKKLQYALYSETFTKVFNESLEEHLEWVCSTNILTLISDPIKKEKFAAIQYKKTNYPVYLKYYTTHSAIPIIKKKINFTSDISQRIDLLKLLVEVCYTNYDLISLEEVIKYFVVRHKNEDRSIRANFITNILNKFKCEDFNENHWSGIIDIIKVQRMKEEHVHISAIYKYIEFLHRNDKPLQNTLDMFLKEAFNGECLPSIENYNPDVWRIVLVEFVKNYTSSSVICNEDIELRLISYLLSFNQKYPNQAIDILGNAQLYKALKSRRKHYMKYDLYVNFYEVICKNNRNRIEDEIMEQFWEYPKENENWKIIKWFIKNDFETLYKYIDKIIEGSFWSDDHICYWMKKYSHLDFDKKLIDYCKKEIAKKTGKNRLTYVKPLTILMSPEDLLMTVEEYLPKSDKIDLTDEDAKEFYSLQCEFAKQLKNSVCINTLLPAILKFCIGDYLESALPSLYSACYRIPENKLGSVLKHIFNKAVSVRKHALFLCCQLVDEATVMELLNNVASTEKDLSIKKHLFSVAMKFFRRSPSDRTWSLVETFMNFIEKIDTESLNLLIDSKIPSKYKVLHFTTSWNFLEKNIERFANYEWKLESMLYEVDDKVTQQLDLDFSLKIIKNNFLKNGNLMENGIIITFVVQFLLVEKRIDTFKFIFDIISEYKKHNWDKTDKNTFISSFYNEFLFKRENDYFTKEFVCKFTEHWSQTFTPIEAFKEFVAINVLKIYKESDNNPKLLTENLTPFVEGLYAQYSPLQVVINKFVVDTLELLFGNKQETKLTICKYVLEAKHTTEIIELVLNFLNSISNKLEKSLLQLRDNILDEIENMEEETVQICYNLYLQDQAKRVY